MGSLAGNVEIVIKCQPVLAVIATNMVRLSAGTVRSPCGCSAYGLVSACAYVAAFKQ